MLECIPDAPVEHTTGKINPAKTCQPIGAMYAALGIHGCLPHSHGSQGCCAYHRMHLTRHFRDPVLASSSFLYRRGIGFWRSGEPQDID